MRNLFLTRLSPDFIFRSFASVLFICFPLALFPQDTIILKGDTIRVGGLEWDLEKDYRSSKPIITNNAEIYGENISIFHSFYPKAQTIEQIVFGYEDSAGFVAHGPARYYYSTGELLGLRTFVDGLMEGLALDYHKNGMIKVLANFRHDSLTGEFKSNYETGITDTECEYNNGAIEGMLRMYYTNGDIKSSSYFSGGLQQGGDTTYFETGDIWKIMHFENGIRNGPYKIFHRNGRISTEWVYSSGKLSSVRLCQNADGRPLEPGSFSKGNGWVNIYDERGFLKETVKFREGAEVKRKLVRMKAGARPK